MESIPELLKSLKIQSLAGAYANPILTRFLAPIDCFKIPALEWEGRAEGGSSWVYRYCAMLNPSATDVFPNVLTWTMRPLCVLWVMCHVRSIPYRAGGGGVRRDRLGRTILKSLYLMRSMSGVR
jgi:hypothetical protein